MLLDLFCYLLLLAPFAFFWCCCTQVCLYCPDGVQLNCSVTIPGVVGTSPVFCDECDDISAIMFTAIYIPTVPSGPCQWFTTTEFAEGLCREPTVIGDVTIGLVKYEVTVAVEDGLVGLTLQAVFSPSTSAGLIIWTKAMPDHSGSPATGPCPAQTITFDSGDISTGPTDDLGATCDFSASEPEITFF